MIKLFNLLDSPQIHVEASEIMQNFAAMNVKYKYFIPDNRDAIQLFGECYKICVELAQNHEYNHAGFLAAEHAYRLVIFFGRDNIQDTLQVFDHFIEKHSTEFRMGYDVNGKSRTMTQIFKQMTLPVSSDYGAINLEAWKEKLLDLGPDVLKYGKHLPLVEQKQGSIPSTNIELQEGLSKALYKTYDKNPEFAKLSKIYGLNSLEYIQALRNFQEHKYSTKLPMPDFIVDLQTNDDIADKHYFAKLPDNDMRSAIFREDDYLDLLRQNLDTQHGFYVNIQTSSSNKFDPDNIDWHNLENQGHKITAYYFLFAGQAGEIRVCARDLHSFQANRYDSDLWKAVGPKFLELIPGLETLSGMHSWRDDGTHFESWYDVTELAELKKQIWTDLRDAHLGENHIPPSPNYCHTQYYHTSSLSHAKKIALLDKEYLKYPQFSSSYELLSQFVIGECSTAEEIKSVHQELKKLKNDTPERYELLVKCAHYICLVSDVRYSHLKNLSDEMLEFLTSYDARTAYENLVTLEQILENAQNPIDMKRNVLKAYTEKLLHEPEFISAIDQLSEEQLDIMISADAVTIYSIGGMNLRDIYTLEVEILELLLSETTVILYKSGNVTYQDLLKDGGSTLDVKQHILSELILLAAIENNSEHIDFSPILELSEKQLDALIETAMITDMHLYFDGYMKLISIISNHPEADERYITRKALEIRLATKLTQNIPEDFIVNLPDDKFTLLQSWEAQSFLKHRYGTVEFLMSQDVEVIAAITFYEINSAYRAGWITSAHLVEFGIADIKTIIERHELLEYTSPERILTITEHQADKLTGYYGDIYLKAGVKLETLLGYSETKLGKLCSHEAMDIIDKHYANATYLAGLNDDTLSLVLKMEEYYKAGGTIESLLSLDEQSLAKVVDMDEYYRHGGTIEALFSCDDAKINTIRQLDQRWCTNADSLYNYISATDLSTLSLCAIQSINSSDAAKKYLKQGGDIHLLSTLSDSTLITLFNTSSCFSTNLEQIDLLCGGDYLKLNLIMHLEPSVVAILTGQKSILYYLLGGKIEDLVSHTTQEIEEILDTRRTQYSAEIQTRISGLNIPNERELISESWALEIYASGYATPEFLSQFDYLKVRRLLSDQAVSYYRAGCKVENLANCDIEKLSILLNYYSSPSLVRSKTTHQIDLNILTKFSADQIVHLLDDHRFWHSDIALLDMVADLYPESIGLLGDGAT